MALSPLDNSPPQESKVTISTKDTGEITIHVNETIIELGADGLIKSYRHKNKQLKTPALEQEDSGAPGLSENLDIGDKMPDGTIYAGISPRTGRPMYVLPEEASGTLKWKAAMKYAENLDAHGHQDWKLPTASELRVLFENRAKIGGFTASGSDPAVWTWTCDEWDDEPVYARAKNFHRNGDEGWWCKTFEGSTRPVRLGPAPAK